MAHVKGEAEGLGEEELGGEDVFRRCLANCVGEFGEAVVVVFGLCGEEEAGFEDCGGGIGHRAVRQIEALEVLDCCRLVRSVLKCTRGQLGGVEGCKVP